MSLPDPEPPRRSFDKPLWVFLFVFAPILAPLAFLLWKKTAVSAQRVGPADGADDPMATGRLTGATSAR